MSPMWFPFRGRKNVRSARSSASSRSRRQGRNPATLQSETLEPRSMLAAVNLVTSPNGDGLYKAGDQLIIQVDFAAPVTITTGSPLLRLNSGSFAEFAGQSGAGATLNFRYQVAQGDTAADLDVLSPSAIVNATFSDADGAFTPTLPVGTGSGVTTSLAFLKNIVVDTTAPAAPIVNTLRVNPTIEETNPGYTQVHPDYFTVTGTLGSGPLASGETLTVAVNGCTYVLGPSSTGAPDANGVWRVDLLTTPTSGGPLTPWSTTAPQQYQVVATARDAVGNTSVGYGFVIIDMTGPTVQNVTAANPNGAYKAGDVIDVQVLFLEPVAVVTNQGTPQLALKLDSVRGGGPGRVLATYDAAKSSGTRMVFSYTVLAGDTVADLDYDGTTAISLNSGMIQDLAGNPASLTLPAAAAAGSLGFNKDIVIDTTAPVIPLISDFKDSVGVVAKTGTIASPGVSDDTLPVLTGTAELNNTVKIYNGVGGALLGTVTANQAPTTPATPGNPGTGTWKFQPTLALADGRYDFVAISTDAAGNDSPASLIYTVTIDATAPIAPVIATVEDSGPPMTVITSGGYTDKQVLVLKGTAEVGSTVAVYDNSSGSAVPIPGTLTMVGSAWMFTTVALAEGPHSFQARTTDLAGNISPASTAYDVVIDTTAPLAAGISSVADDVLPITAPVFSGDRTNDTRPTLSGTCEPNSVVRVFATFNGGTTVALLGTATVVGSTWTFTPAAPLAEGSYAFTATVTDRAGNTSVSSTAYTVVIDTTAPNPPLVTGVDDNVAPFIGNVASGRRTNDTVLTLNGTVAVTVASGDSITQVEIFDGATSLGLAVLGAATTAGGVTTYPWTFATGTLTDGTTYSFTARATDAAGNVSNPSAPPYVVTIDTTAPTPPSITSYLDVVGTVTGVVTDGGVSNDTTPVLSGTMQAGTTGLEIWDNGVQIVGTLVLTSATTWQFRPASALTDGLHQFTAIAVDDASNRSTPSLPYSVTVDTVGLMPSIVGVADDVAPIIANVPNGGSTNDTVLVLTGTAEAGSVVELYNDVGTSPILLGYPTLTGTSWTFTTSTLAEGTYNFKARIIDSAGNASDLPDLLLTPAYTVTVDLTAPARPIISALVDDVPEITTPVPNGGVTNDTSLLIQGTAEPRAQILVYNNGTTLFGLAIADATGAWSLQTGSLVNGTTYAFTATATDAAGNVSASSLPPYAVTIDLTAPAAPAITSVTDNAGSFVGPLSSGDSTDDTTLAISGTTAAGTVVHVIINGGTPTAASVSGTTWNFTTTPLASGTYSIVARTTNAAGNTAFSAPFMVTVDATAPAAPTITSVMDDVAPVTGPIAPGGVTNDTVLVLQGTTEAGSTVRVYDGGADLGPASVVGTVWTFTTGPLANGTSHSFTATATDAVGNTSSPTSPAFNVTIDTSAPLPPVITGVTDDVGLYIGTVLNGGLTNDSQPTIAGTAEPNSRVSIYNGLTLLGVAVADTNGLWSFTTGSLASGVRYDLRATAADAAGNTSAFSAPDYVVTVDAIAPDAPAIMDVVDDVSPVIGTVVNGGFSNDTSLVLTGTAPSDATLIRIFNASTLLGTVSPVSGAWTYVTTGLVNGATYAFNAVAIDAAGNASAASPSWTVTIDTTAPATPTIVGVDDDVLPTVGTVLSGGFTNDTTLVLTIQTDATPGAVSSVTVYNGGTPLGLAAPTATPGVWTFSASGLVDGGTYSFRAVATDAAGNNSSQSTPWVVTVDTTAPNPPTLTGSATGGIVTLSGTTELQSGVRIYRDGVALGLATVVGTNFQLSIPGMADGVYTFEAESIDRAGNVSLRSLAVVVVVDTVAPNAPAIAGVADDVLPVIGSVSPGGTTNDSRPFVTGTMQAGTTRVQLLDNSVPVGDATLTSATTWTYQFVSTLVDGGHSLTAVAYDAANNVSTLSSAYAFAVLTIPPAAPVIGNLADDVSLVIGNVANGGTTNDSLPLLSGSMQSGTARVDIFDNGVLAGSATFLSGTTWAYQFVAPPLADGAHALTAVAYDAAGNVSSSSVAFNVTIDTLAPSVPVIASVADDVAPVTGAVANGGSTNDTLPFCSGTMQAGTTQVQIFDNGVLVGNATLTSTTTWAYQFTGVLADGIHVLTAVATDAAGNVSVASSSYSILVDTVAPSAPFVESAVDDVGATRGIISANGSTDDSSPLLTGSMAAGDTVRIFRNGVDMGLATATSATTWQFQAPTLAIGSHTFTAVSSDAAGNVSGSSGGYVVNVIGEITASSPTFPASPSRVLSSPVTTFSIVFNTPVAGFSVGNLRLYYGSTSTNVTRLMSLRGASVRQASADGTVWSVTLPLTSVRNRGHYRLDVLPGAIYATLTGGIMAQTQSFSWRRA